MEINHWSHDHPLVLSEEKADDVFSCKGCYDLIVGLCYCCLECNYVLHKWCAELPRGLTNHQLHPNHTLIRMPSLVANFDLEDTNGPICKACETEIYVGSSYSCEHCSFALHARCAVLEKQIEFEYLGPDSVLVRKFYNGYHFSLLPLKEKKFTLTQKITNWDDCFVCKEKLGYSCFSSENGQVMIHIQCALLPKIVKHERHLHDLVLHVPIEKDLEYDECFCDVCEKERDPNDWVYYCTRCELAAHLGCGITGLDQPYQQILKNNTVYKILKQEQHHLQEGNLGSITRCIDEMEKEKERRTERTSGHGKGFEVLEHFSHKHPLTLYDEQWNGAFECDACNINIFGKTYVCNICEFYLHKICAELPREIQHRNHLEHPLTLLPRHDFNCNKCGIKNRGFSYSCEECNFRLHTTCALLPENLNHESHKHSLNAVIFTPHGQGLAPVGNLPIRSNQTPPCNACRFPCQGMSLECNQCSFFLHLVCALYPPTGKAETHRHSLSLEYSYQEDPIALEFICDACEKPRDPNIWLYCCPDPKCYFVAHFDCAVPKLFSTPSNEQDEK